MICTGWVYINLKTGSMELRKGPVPAKLGWVRARLRIEVILPPQEDIFLEGKYEVPKAIIRAFQVEGEQGK